jgi:hypothetical protein
MTIAAAIRVGALAFGLFAWRSRRSDGHNLSITHFGASDQIIVRRSSEYPRCQSAVSTCFLEGLQIFGTSAEPDVDRVSVGQSQPVDAGRPAANATLSGCLTSHVSDDRL